MFFYIFTYVFVYLHFFVCFCIYFGFSSYKIDRLMGDLTIAGGAPRLLNYQFYMKKIQKYIQKHTKICKYTKIHVNMQKNIWRNVMLGLGIELQPHIFSEGAYFPGTNPYFFEKGPSPTRGYQNSRTFLYFFIYFLHFYICLCVFAYFCVFLYIFLDFLHIKLID